MKAWLIRFIHYHKTTTKSRRETTVSITVGRGAWEATWTPASVTAAAKSGYWHCPGEAMVVRAWQRWWQWQWKAQKGFPPASPKQLAYKLNYKHQLSA